ncbi:hypothetical protein SprV_0902657700 [Sparganum proliferum]
MSNATSPVDLNNGSTNSLSPKERILFSPRLFFSCEVINGLLFICAIILLAVGTYNLRLLNIYSKDCSRGEGGVCRNKSSSSAGSYAMIAVGCILIVLCAILIGVMLILSRETSKYVRQLANQLPTYEEAVHSVGSGETWMDDVWTVCQSPYDSAHAKQNNLEAFRRRRNTRRTKGFTSPPALVVVLADNAEWAVYACLTQPIIPHNLSGFHGIGCDLPKTSAHPANRDTRTR